jgi:PAS domain S-box-containing protein
LLVDDELGLLKVAKPILEMKGPFQVDTASSVEEAMEKMKKELYDAVVSDYQMPGKDGLEFLKELREKGNTTPFIVFTGKGREEVAIKALNLGANQYLSKVGEPETVYTELAHSITELAKTRKAEQELRDSEERFRNLFEKANDGLVFVDLSGRMMDINQKLVHMAERTKEDIVGKSFLELGLISSKDVPALVDRLRQNAMGKSTGSLEFEIGEENSEKKSIEINSVLIRKDNMPLGSLVIVRDITERKKKEEALRESEEKYKDLFESAMDVILTLDLKGNVAAVNSSILRFGYKKEDLVGKSILDFVPKEYWPTVMRDFSQVTRGEPARNETEIVVPTGKILVEYNARAIVKESNVIGVQLNLRDVTERKKVEEAVRSSEAKLKAILASSPEAISVSDLNAKLIDCNEAFLKLHGYLSKEELIGTSWLDVIAPANRSKIQDTMGKLSEHGYIKNMEFALLKKDGQEFMGELSASLVLDSSGKPTSIVAVARDITERKEMEEKLKESEGRFRDLFQSIQDPVGIFVGREGHLIDYNTAFKKSSGYTDEELKDKVFLDFVHPDDRAMVLEKYQTKYSEEELPLVYEMRGMNKKGESIPLELSVSTYKRKGRVIGIEVIHRNITERKKAEQTILESQKKFERLFMDNPEPAVHLDRNFHVMDINPRFTALFRYSLEEVKGKHINDVAVPKEKMEEAETLDKKAANGIVYFDTVRKRKDGTLIPVSISAAPLIVNNQLLGHVAVYKDISELKKAEHELATMNEKLQVVGGLTRHDVRNKLSVITGNIYLNKKRMADHPDVLGSYKDMESACEQIVRIFDFAKDYEMLGVEELAYVDMEDAVQKAVSLFSDLKGVKVLNECYGLTVLADSLLRSLFYNLIDNSLKYAQKLSRIRIYYEKKDDELKLNYEDDGVGIAWDAKPKIFDEGYTTGKGSGYGLYLVKRMMEVYGWAIQETGTPGKGAQFTIAIPKTNKDGKENYQLR